MKSCFACGPIDALDVIHQNRAFYLVDDDRKCEWIRSPLAGQGTNHNEAAGAIVGLIGQYQSWPTLTLFVADLRVKIEPGNIADIGNVSLYHSTLSRPESGPQSVSG